MSAALGVDMRFLFHLDVVVVIDVEHLGRDEHALAIANARFAADADFHQSNLPRLVRTPIACGLSRSLSGRGAPCVRQAETCRLPRESDRPCRPEPEPRDRIVRQTS